MNDEQMANDNEVLTAQLLDEVNALAFLSVLKAATELTATTERVLRSNGLELSAKEWDILALVAPLGPLRPGELLSRASLTRSAQTLTSVLDRLEERGLIARAPHPEDSRGVLVSITETGNQTVAETFPHLARELLAPFNAHFTEDELKTLALLLGRL